MVVAKMIELGEVVENATSGSPRHAGRILEVEDWRAGSAQADTLMLSFPLFRTPELAMLRTGEPKRQGKLDVQANRDREIDKLC